jgi:hypothetical protein
MAMGKSFVQMTKEEYWSMSHGIIWKGRLLGRAGRWWNRRRRASSSWSRGSYRAPGPPFKIHGGVVHSCNRHQRSHRGIRSASQKRRPIGPWLCAEALGVR